MEPESKKMWVYGKPTGVVRIWDLKRLGGESLQGRTLVEREGLGLGKYIMFISCKPSVPVMSC